MPNATSKPPASSPAWRKPALELGPLLLFFVAYRLEGLMVATGVIILASLAALALTYHWERKIAVLPLVTATMITVFGGLTLWLQDEHFIKMKPTLVNLLFAGALLGGLAFGRPMLRDVLGSAIPLTEKGWRALSLRWGLYFLFLAGLNELIWRNFSTDFWVDFKVFGMFTCTLLFTLAQLPLMKRYSAVSESELAESKEVK